MSLGLQDGFLPSTNTNYQRWVLSADSWFHVSVNVQAKRHRCGFFNPSFWEVWENRLQAEDQVSVGFTWGEG